MTLSPAPPALPTTLASAVAWAQARLQDAGADAPRLTALILLEHAAGIRREEVLAHPERVLAPDHVAAFNELVERRARREPLAYILGYREFYGLPFQVNESTLIPGPETEGMIDLALDWLSRQQRQAPWCLDVGTGSGAIALTLLRSCPQLTAIATDISSAALAIAQANATHLQVSDRSHFVACNLADAVCRRVPLVLANLPYIPTREIDGLEPEVCRYEPRSALDGGRDGVAAIHALLDRMAGLLEPGGLAILEIGDSQGVQLRNDAQLTLPESHVRLEKDAAGRDRFILIERGS